MSESPWDSLNIKDSSSMEQAETSLENLAQSLAVFCNSLVKHGFTRDEAAFMTTQFMHRMFQQKSGNE